MPYRLRLAILTLALLLNAGLPLFTQERPWSVSPCELLKNPGMYNETLVSVPALLLYGGGEFTAHGYDCTDDYGVLRLEFGGNPTDPKDQFRLPQSRLEAGVVPLKKDQDYNTLQQLMKSIDASGTAKKMLRATLNGRYFAGPAFGKASGEITHPNARLVISEIELVSDRAEDPVDFTPAPKTALRTGKGCTATVLAVPTREEEDKLQRLSREPSENLEYLADPAKVAANAIATAEKLDTDRLLASIKPVSEGVAVKDYAWTSADGLRTYTVTVSRPYWLLPSTYSGNTVIWVPKRMLLNTCPAKPSR